MKSKKILLTTAFTLLAVVGLTLTYAQFGLLSPDTNHFGQRLLKNSWSPQGPSLKVEPIASVFDADRFSLSGQGSVTRQLNGVQRNGVAFYTFKLRPVVGEEIEDGTLVNVHGAVIGYRLYHSPLPEVIDPALLATMPDEIKPPEGDFSYKGYTGKVFAFNANAEAASEDAEAVDPWEDTGIFFDLNAEGVSNVTVRLTVRVDRKTGLWDLYMLDNLLLADLGLARGKATTASIQSTSEQPTSVIGFWASSTNPHATDSDGDAIPDAFEKAHGANPFQNDRDFRPAGSEDSLLQLYLTDKGGN